MLQFFSRRREARDLRNLSNTSVEQSPTACPSANPKPRDAKVGTRYDLLAGLYDTIDLAELLYKRRARARLLEGLSGRILDAGVGTGCSVPFYPAEAEVVGMDLSPGMLQRAQERGRRMGRELDLVAMDLIHTGFPDASFDAVVSAFTFCTLEESRQHPALSEMARILKPGGELRILDYTLSRHSVLRPIMRVWQVWEEAVFHGAFDRGTERYLAPAGFELVRDEHVVADMVRLFVAKKT